MRQKSVCGPDQATGNPASDINKKWQVGTLHYTPVTLIVMFGFLLLGGFSISFLSVVISQGLFTLSLSQFDPDAAMTISLLVGTIPAILNAVVCPIVSFKSDRTRSRWGRRIPYVLVSVPFLSLMLLAIGWAPVWVPDIAALMGWSLAFTGMLLVGISITIFMFFMNFTGSVFYYLFADVVPEMRLGLFNSLFSLVGGATAAFFAKFILRYADGGLPWIYTGIGIFVFIGFMLMCLTVREGEYPPLPEDQKHLTPLKGIWIFCRECFGADSLYWWIFICVAMNNVSMLCRSIYNILFATETLGLSVAEYGKYIGDGAIVGMIITIPLGILVDKFHPVRVYMVGMLLVIVTNFYGFYWVGAPVSFQIVTVLLAIVYAVQWVSNLPLLIALFPRERYGQFCSALSIFNSLVMIAAPLGAGWLIKVLGYRYIFMWDLVFTAVAMIFMILMYRGWKLNGGIRGYRAP